MSVPVTDDAERIVGQPPALFTRTLAHVLIAITLTALLVAGAVWRETMVDNSLDPVSMALRLMALSALLRALVRLADVIRFRRGASGARQQSLELTDAALVWRHGTATRHVDRTQVLSVCELADGVRLIVRPDNGESIVHLPPIFDASPALLAARLRRWRLPGAAFQPAQPVRLASKAYDAAVDGEIADDMAVLRHGWGWLRRGPLLALLFGIVFLEGALRMPEGMALGMVPFAGLIVCMLVPLGWLWLARRDIAPRRGVAMVVTPAEVVMRTRGGVLRATWRRVDDVRIESTPTWSVLDGARPLRKLAIDRRADTPIRYEEAYLGVPAEVAAALLDAFRKRPEAQSEEE